MCSCSFWNQVAAGIGNSGGAGSDETGLPAFPIFLLRFTADPVRPAAAPRHLRQWQGLLAYRPAPFPTLRNLANPRIVSIAPIVPQRSEIWIVAGANRFLIPSVAASDQNWRAVPPPRLLATESCIISTHSKESLNRLKSVPIIYLQAPVGGLPN